MLRAKYTLTQPRGLVLPCMPNSYTVCAKAGYASQTHISGGVEEEIFP